MLSSSVIAASSGSELEYSASRYQPLNTFKISSWIPYFGSCSPIISPTPKYKTSGSPSKTPTRLTTTFSFHKAYKTTSLVGINSASTGFVQSSS